ncbi:MAG: peptide ABC transporter substrate-binding protein [Verrucomicrobia bacterium]|jgi:oligopeptide transport system substrate-binding protein|nr:peptide ABC transporter substrate-binding protein [Verrucomicrobiota bacterium]
MQRARNASGQSPEAFRLWRVCLTGRVGRSGAFFPLLLALLWLTGCGPALPPAELTIINGAEPESLDPALALSIEDLRVTMPLFEGLTRNDPVTARPIPGLAERWEITADGRTYLFYLRTNAVWSTGEPITAEDVAYSWRRALDPGTGAGYASQLFFIENAESFNAGTLTDARQLGFQAVDAHRFRVQLRQPTPFFLDLCAFQTLAVVPRHAVERLGDQWIRAQPLPVSGPYQLDFWRLNDRVRLRKNPRYWDAANTAIEVVDLLTIANPATAFNLYETGHADVIWDRNLVPAELLDLLRQRPDCHRFDFLAVYFVRFNTTRPPLDDARVRRALSLAIDRQRIVGRITRGGEQPAAGMVPPGTANHLATRAVEFDLAAARRLLAEAGHPGGTGLRPLRYLYWTAGAGTGQEHAKIAVELKTMWEQGLGLRVELDNREKRVFIAAQRQLDYDLSQSSWVGDYDDPNTFLDLFVSRNGNNRTGWSNSDYDLLLERANREPDLGRRAALLSEAERLLVGEQAPVAPVYFASGFNFFRPDQIAGIYPNLLDVHPLNAIRKISQSR